MSIVYLIGAGPGDPGLITVRGLQYLAAADVVLYDHIVPARLLRHARPDAEKIDVGVAAPQPLEQEAICYLLAEKAREDRKSTRLNSSHPSISYAVFCLKKKKKHITQSLINNNKIIKYKQT